MTQTPETHPTPPDQSPASDADAEIELELARALYREAGISNSDESWERYRKDAAFQDYWAGKAARFAAAHKAALERAHKRIMDEELTEQQLANGVVALIDAGLDGRDGVGHSDVEAVWKAIKAAQS